jgi:hypothetical protein
MRQCRFDYSFHLGSKSAVVLVKYRKARRLTDDKIVTPVSNNGRTRDGSIESQGVALITVKVDSAVLNGKPVLWK